MASRTEDMELKQECSTSRIRPSFNLIINPGSASLFGVHPMRSINSHGISLREMLLPQKMKSMIDKANYEDCKRLYAVMKSFIFI